MEGLVRIDRRVLNLGVHIAYSLVTNVAVSREHGELLEHIKTVVGGLANKYTLNSLKDHPVIRAYRDFMWRLGIDPTKVRPSSEALLRRLLRGKPFPRINNVVDSGNLASVETLIPIGLYDADKATFPLILRFANRGEVFDPIGGDRDMLLGNEIVLSDARGLILHIYPHRDCKATMIRESTKNVLVVATGVPGIPQSLVMEAAELASKYIEKYASGNIGEEVTWVG